MIFPKDFLAEKFEEKISNVSNEQFPFKSNYDNYEGRSPFKMILSNYFTAFDLKSNEMKDLVYKARKEIIETCFKDEYMGVIPNNLKIQDCIQKINNQYYGELFDRRTAYFGNSK